MALSMNTIRDFHTLRAQSIYNLVITLFRVAIYHLPLRRFIAHFGKTLVRGNRILPQ